MAPKKEYKNLSGKMIQHIHSKKKSIIYYLETAKNGDFKLWLEGGTFITRKQFSNYRLFWNGWKPLTLA